MFFSSFITLAVLASSTLAFPSFSMEEIKRAAERQRCNDKQQARLFVIPPPPASTASKKIPGTLLLINKLLSANVQH
jgi:hypothetical protein